MADGSSSSSATSSRNESHQSVASALAAYQHWTTVIVTIIIGAVLIGIAHKYIDETTIYHDVLRDLGIAAFVAAIIAPIYETHARRRFELMLADGFLSVVVSDWSRRDIWEVVKSQIIEKSVVRDDFRLGIQLSPNTDLSEGQMLLQLNVKYMLRGLRSQAHDVVIRHFLDQHLRIKRLNLPHFESIYVDDVKIPLTQHNLTEDGKFFHQVKVDKRNGKALRIDSKRHEIIYIPGNHCFTMGEITKGIELCLEGIPKDLRVFVAIRSADVEKFELKQDAPSPQFSDDNLVLLPGQIIELVFQRQEDSERA
jgi:hypothetical protein